MKNAIINRKSQRSYNGIPLHKEDEEKLISYINDEKNLIGLHNHKIHIYYVKTLGIPGGKIGTYGVIKNAPSYLVVVCENTTEGMLDTGYVFENLVLYLENLGIGTCWLGGTYNKRQVHVPISENEIIPIISPIGYPAEKKAFTDKAFRRFANSDKRLPFDCLFYFKEFSNPITNKIYQDLLEYVRLAPSASNKQPWRVVVDEKNIAHFYIERTPNYGAGKLSCDLQMLDIGIALSHYAIAKENVSFIIENPKIEMLSEYSSYVVSVK